jgi:TM2 domain-containing membrane protein YozV
VREPDVLPTGSGASWEWWGLKGSAGRRPSLGRPRRPLIAALLSCLLPGAGQLWLGYRRRGTIMLVVTALCLAVAVGLWSEPTTV